MAIKVAVPGETAEGEKRVALIPAVATRIAGMGAEILVEKGAGKATRIPDEAWEDATLVEDAAAACKDADIVLRVTPPTPDEVKQFREGAIYIGYLGAHQNHDTVKALRDRKITAFSMEYVPRISRAQSIDALSSQAAVAGYKAALKAADMSGRFFPMLTTAAGTIRPATVLVVGAGVAGLQAIATAKRLGARVEAYDVRPEAKEQVEALGAKFRELDLEASVEGGYARELTDEEKQKQQQMLADHVAKADAVITTAAVPGRPAPKIIPTSMVDNMKPGAVIVDLAAETGGNCEVTKPGEVVEHGDALVYGPVNVPSMLAEHASEMYAKNLMNFITLILKEGELTLDWEDEVLAKSVVTHEGEIKHQATRELVEGGKS